jgi:hypothetical protein
MNYVSESNIETIVEVLHDQNIIINKEILSNEMINFYEKKYRKNNFRINNYSELMTFNKDFLKKITNDYQQYQLQLKQQTKEPQIRQEKKQLYKNSDIQSQRLEEFEKNLENKKKEFDEYNAPKKPQEVNFSSNEKDETITEMEKIIAETIAKRNFEISQIQQNISSSTNPSQVKKWLNQEDTSIQSEKNKNYDQELKMIKIEKEELGLKLNDVIDLEDDAKKRSILKGNNILPQNKSTLSNQQQKKLTWEDSNKILNSSQITNPTQLTKQSNKINEDGFLSKLKKDSIQITENKDENNNIKISINSNTNTEPRIKNKNRIDQMIEVQKQGLELFRKKNTDYGDAFAQYGVIGVLMRIQDKIQRAVSINKNGINLVKDERIEDTLIDLHNYAAMGLMLLNEE